MSRKEDFIQAGIDYRFEHGKQIAIGGDKFADVANEMNRCKDFEEGAEYGYQYALQHPQWIPVKERLPEETEVVLGVREGGTDVEMYKFMGFNESTNTFDWEWHPYYCAVVDDVTHWMPIVPPRKEE